MVFTSNHMKQPKYVLGEIISPGFPGNYDNNLDVTWMLEAQIGQMIEINFLHFDLESHSSCR